MAQVFPTVQSRLVIANATCPPHHPIKSIVTMPEPIVSIERIKADARAAAALYDHINDACPYSFYTEAGRVFKAEFTRVRMEEAMSKTAAAKGAKAAP